MSHYPAWIQEQAVLEDATHQDNHQNLYKQQKNGEYIDVLFLDFSSVTKGQLCHANQKVLDKYIRYSLVVPMTVWYPIIVVIEEHSSSTCTVIPKSPGIRCKFDTIHCLHHQPPRQHIIWGRSSLWQCHIQHHGLPKNTSKQSITTRNARSTLEDQISTRLWAEHLEYSQSNKSINEQWVYYAAQHARSVQTEMRAG